MKRLAIVLGAIVVSFFILSASPFAGKSGNVLALPDPPILDPWCASLTYDSICSVLGAMCFEDCWEKKADCVQKCGQDNVDYDGNPRWRECMSYCIDYVYEPCRCDCLDERNQCFQNLYGMSDPILDNCGREPPSDTGCGPY